MGVKPSGLQTKGFDEILARGSSMLKSLKQHNKQQSLGVAALSAAGNEVDGLLPHVIA